MCLYLVQHLLHQIKVQQFYTDLDLYQKCQVLQKIEELKYLSRHLSDFPVLFKADLIFKDFSKKPSKFKYFSSLCQPCKTNSILNKRKNNNEKYTMTEKANSFQVLIRSRTELYMLFVVTVFVFVVQ